MKPYSKTTEDQYNSFLFLTYKNKNADEEYLKKILHDEKFEFKPKEYFPINFDQSSILKIESLFNFFVDKYKNHMLKKSGLNTVETVKNQDGSQFYGEFDKQGVLLRGKTIFSDGTTIEGDIVHGVYEGECVINNCSVRYYGIFKNNMCVEGIVVDEGKYFYVGEMECGIPNGKGLIIFKNGDVYAGDFFRGFHHGYGAITLSHGSKITGTWKEGKYFSHPSQKQ